MKKYLIILMLLLSSVSFAQKLVVPISIPKSTICGTPEATEIEMQSKFYYGNNDRLQEKYDSLAQIYGDVGGNPSGNPSYRNGTYGGEDNIWFRVPVKFWIYQWTSANSLEYPERSVKSMIWALNDAYRRNNIPVRFFTSCYQFVENQAAASNSRISDSDVKDLMSSNKEFAAINIHIMNNPSSSAYFKFDNSGNALNSIVLRRSAIGTGLYPTFSPFTSYKNSTFIHEVGHYFQLEHTHRDTSGPCKELVTRGWVWSVCLNSFSYTKQCEWRADALCDTEADPNLEDYISSISSDCRWVGNLQDQRGDTYRPNPKNYMSYANDGCQSVFTGSQKAIILANIADRNSIFLNLWEAYAQDFTDIYEPDNVDAMATPINVNEVQEHTFGNILSFGCPDNEDWLSYRKTNLIVDLFVEIEDVGGFNNPALDVEFWESNGTDISPKASLQRTYVSVVNQGSKRIYRVSCGSMIDGGIYLFRVRRNGVQTGRYTITLRADLPVVSGTGVTCSGGAGSYTVFPVPPGATITWQGTGANIISGQGTPNALVSVGIGVGTGTVQATVTGCGTSYTTPPFSVLITGTGLDVNYHYSNGTSIPLGIVYTMGDTENPNTNNICAGYIHSGYLTAGVAPSSTVTFAALGGITVSYRSPTSAYINLAFGAVGRVRVSTTNLCGTVAQTFTFRATNCGTPNPPGNPNPPDPCSNPPRLYNISPNPASGQIKIGISADITEKPMEIPCPRNPRKSVINSKDGITFSEVKIYNSFGILVLSQKMDKAKEFVIPLNELRAGLYLVQISEGEYIERHQIIIE